MAYEGFSWLRAGQIPHLLAPLTTAQAREAEGRPARWARFVARMLSASGVLHSGKWEVLPAYGETEDARYHGTRMASWMGRRVQVISVCQPERALERRDADRWSWDVDGGGWLLGLRQPSSPEAGRVKAWRKVARAGMLPPLVIYFVSALDSWLLLDGHDRLLAATLESVPVPMISVSAVRELDAGPDPEEQARIYEELKGRFGGAGPLDLSTTRSLAWAIRAKFPSPSFTIFKSRAWPIPGGRETWRSEVLARLRGMNVPEMESVMLEDAPTRQH
jgi:hypothetical protein